MLAVAAVDELTALEAIEKIDIDWEPLPFNVDPLDSLRPGRPNARTQGNTWMRPETKPGQPPAALSRISVDGNPSCTSTRRVLPSTSSNVTVTVVPAQATPSGLVCRRSTTFR